MVKIYLIFLFDALVVLAHIFLRNKLGFFDLDKEGNLASLYSGMKLWVVAAAAFAHVYILAARPRSFDWRVRLEPWAWRMFAAGLLYIGLDDMMAVHERMGFVFNNIFHTGGFYGESFNWIFYFSPLIGLALAVFIFLNVRLWREDKIAAIWCAAGIILWIGSLGAELIGRALILRPVISVPLYHALIVGEELLEMLGATAFAALVTKILARNIARHVKII